MLLRKWDSYTTFRQIKAKNLIDVTYEAMMLGISIIKDGIKTGEVSYDVNGKKDGKWKVWDNQGNIRAQMSYKNGERSGLWKTWDENGSVINEKRF